MESSANENEKEEKKFREFLLIIQTHPPASNPIAKRSRDDAEKYRGSNMEMNFHAQNKIF